MTDEIDVKLPISGKTVVIRNYTTRADDEKAEAVLYAGVSGTKSGEFNFPIANVMASTAVYVQRLVKSVDGENKNTLHLLENLRSEDYAAVEDAVSGVVSANSPKAKKSS